MRVWVCRLYVSYGFAFDFVCHLPAIYYKCSCVRWDVNDLFSIKWPKYYYCNGLDILFLVFYFLIHSNQNINNNATNLT